MATRRSVRETLLHVTIVAALLTVAAIAPPAFGAAAQANPQPKSHHLEPLSERDHELLMLYVMTNAASIRQVVGPQRLIPFNPRYPRDVFRVVYDKAPDRATRAAAGAALTDWSIAGEPD